MQDPENPGRWEVPGGRMEFGEDVNEHICREVREEVGVEIEPGAPFHMWQWIMPDRAHPDNRIQVVAVGRVCKAATSNLGDAARQSDDFIADARWVPVTALQSYDFIPSLRPAMDLFINSFASRTSL
jgi:8-oxo-dGTP pyrophosphatase MutT (NUDIX family)